MNTFSPKPASAAIFLPSEFVGTHSIELASRPFIALSFHRSLFHSYAWSFPPCFCTFSTNSGPSFLQPHQSICHHAPTSRQLFPKPLLYSPTPAFYVQSLTRNLLRTQLIVRHVFRARSRVPYSSKETAGSSTKCTWWPLTSLATHFL